MLILLELENNTKINDTIEGIPKIYNYVASICYFVALIGRGYFFTSIRAYMLLFFVLTRTFRYFERVLKSLYEYEYFCRQIVLVPIK
jgi:hypothetical protein